MQISLEKSDLKTLKKGDDDLWSYSIKTKKGRVLSSGFIDKEEAIKSAERHLSMIAESLLEKE